jgi:hypothetical protein
MPTYADYGGWVISIIAGWFAVSADIHTDADHGMLVVDKIKQAERLRCFRKRMESNDPKIRERYSIEGWLWFSGVGQRMCRRPAARQVTDCHDNERFIVSDRIHE